VVAAQAARRSFHLLTNRKERFPPSVVRPCTSVNCTLTLPSSSVCGSTSLLLMRIVGDPSGPCTDLHASTPWVPRPINSLISRHEKPGPCICARKQLLPDSLHSAIVRG
jgi:hypothetical protein